MSVCIQILLVFALPMVLVGSIFSQVSPTNDDDVIRVETQLVDVPIVVNGKDGKPILNLNKNNFIIYEDGAQQEINNFSTVAAPFEVALLLDTSGSTRNDLALIQKAAEDFIASLRKGDRVAVISFDTSEANGRRIAVAKVLNALTEDRMKLKSSVANVRTSNGTPYYDGLLLAVDKVFADPPAPELRGRRALVALTDGVDSTSLADFAEAKEKIQRAGFVNYFIQVDTREFFEEGLTGDCESATRFSVSQIRRYYAMFGKNSKVERVYDFCRLGDFERLAMSKSLYELADSEMKSLAKSSGGKVFPVADLGEARNAFAKVAAELGTKYSLGYYSSNEKRDGAFRKIRVELKGVPAGAQIRAREGYLAPKN